MLVLDVAMELSLAFPFGSAASRADYSLYLLEAVLLAAWTLGESRGGCMLVGGTGW